VSGGGEDTAADGSARARGCGLNALCFRAPNRNNGTAVPVLGACGTNLPRIPVFACLYGIAALQNRPTIAPARSRSPAGAGFLKWPQSKRAFTLLLSRSVSFIRR
jgi:hypothetical protein